MKKKRRQRTLSSLVTQLTRRNETMVLRIFKWRLQHGADPRAQEKDGYTPLHNVVEFHVRNHPKLRGSSSTTTLEMATLLVQYGANPDGKDMCGRTPLHMLGYQLSKDNQHTTLEMARLLLKLGADPNAETQYNGKTLLHQVVEFHARTNPLQLPRTTSTTLEMVRLLIESGAYPDKKDMQGRTPLHILSTWVTTQDTLTTTLPVVRLLLHYGGANPKTQDKYGYTPLHYLACQLVKEDESGIEELFRFLWSPRIDPNLRDTTDLYRLIVSCPFRKENQEATRNIIRSLLQYGADVGAQNEKGLTPLHCLVGQLTKDNQEGTVEMIRFLLELGANPNVQDAYGYTPLHRLIYQFEQNDPETMLTVASILLEGGIHLGAQDKDGVTVLHLLVGGLHKFIRRRLILVPNDENEIISILNPKASLPLLAKLLLEHKRVVVDLDIPDQSGRTVLHYFARKAASTTVANTIDMVYVWKELHILLEYGADPTIKDRFGNLPWDYFHTVNALDFTGAFLFIQSIVIAGIPGKV